MDGRRRAAVVSRGGAEQNPAYRPTRPPLPVLVAGLSQGFAPTHHLSSLRSAASQLLAATLGQVGLLLIEQAVGEGVLARRVRGFGLVTEMLAADHAVLVIAEQRLDGLGLLGHLGLRR